MTAPWRNAVNARPAASYRDDESVPAFPDDKPLMLFDGLCVLCSGFARFIARRDAGGHIRFAACQSPLGTALMRHYGFDPADPETNLLIVDGRALGKLDAYGAIMRLLPAPWPLASLLCWLPQGVGDWLYDRIARNRYAVLRRRQVCIVPDAGWRARVLE